MSPPPPDDPGTLPKRENEHLPSQNSFEFWERLSEPVLKLLEEPRDWPFINEWVKKTGFGPTRVRHAIAWLEQRRKAVSFTRVTRDALSGRRRSQLYWVKREWLKAHEQQLRS